MPVFELGEKKPKLAPGVWIAPNATLIGDARLAENVNIWWNAVLRGDNDPIIIGENSNIQDGAVLHTDDGIPLEIGSDVTVGHMAMLHSCTVGNGALIGIKAVVLNHAVIGNYCLIGANALIPENKVIPERSLVVGSPGKIIRTLDDAQVERLEFSAQHYVANAQRFQQHLRRVQQ